MDKSKIFGDEDGSDPLLTCSKDKLSLVHEMQEGEGLHGIISGARERSSGLSCRPQRNETDKR